jgi:hypothetical protein
MPATMERYENAVARYFEAWNAREPETRAKAVAAAWTVGGGYTAVIAAAHEQFPGFTFQITGPVEGHHDTVRFSWELVSTADGSAPVAGSDVITLAGDGRIRTVYGFLDRVPAEA